MRPSPRLVADGALLLATAVWGISFILVKESLDEADPFSFLAARFGLAAAVASLLAGKQVFARDNVKPGAVLSGLLYLGFGFQTFGLQYTTTARSAFITGLCVLLVPLFAVLFFRRRPQLFPMLGVALAAGGLYLMTGGLGEEGRGTLFGDGLTLVCAVCYAFHILLTERYAPGRSPLALVALQFWGVTILSALALPFIEVRFNPTPTLLWGVVLTALLSSVLAISLQTWAQGRTTATRAALIFTMEPVFASLFAFLLLGERLRPNERWGTGLILAGVLVAELGNAALAHWRETEAGRRQPL